MWKAPRLTDEGKPFEPALGEVGSTVAWAQTVERRSVSGIPEGRFDVIERVGQVWSLAHPLGGKRAVFVVTPEQESAHIAVADLHTPTRKATQ